jgi:hypothetical protein
MLKNIEAKILVLLFFSLVVVSFKVYSNPEILYGSDHFTKPIAVQAENKTASNIAGLPAENLTQKAIDPSLDNSSTPTPQPTPSNSPNEAPGLLVEITPGGYNPEQKISEDQSNQNYGQQPNHQSSDNSAAEIAQIDKTQDKVAELLKKLNSLKQ